MKIITTLLHTFTFFTMAMAQRHIAPEPLRTPGTLSPLPLVYTGKMPDVYLPGDSVTRPHIRTHIVEFSSASVVDNNFLLEGLKRQGLAQGVDGILLSDYRKLVPGNEMLVGSMTGVGIKYVGNLQYIDTILRQKVIRTYGPDGIGGKSAIIAFDLFGNILTNPSSEDLLFYANEMSAYDAGMIMDRLSTFYDYKSFGNDNPYRVVSSKNWPVRISHAVEGAIAVQYFVSTKLGDNEGRRQRFKLSPVYDGNLLTGAIVSTANAKEIPLIYIHYRYDNRGRIAEERWEKLMDGRRTLWLEVENRFFEANEDFTKGLSGLKGN